MVSNVFVGIAQCKSVFLIEDLIEYFVQNIALYNIMSSNWIIKNNSFYQTWHKASLGDGKSYVFN